MDLSFFEFPVTWFFSLNKCPSISSAFVNQIYGIDAASGAAVSALNISLGDHVLDLCVAPGKSAV